VDEWLKNSVGKMSDAPSVDLASLIISLTLSFVLSFALAQVYIRTHRGHSYSRSFVHTIVFVSITIDLIMVIIGSNIARAFALVGAMSIVRFRNPIKDSRDLIFIFMSMGIGMATGTQFYLFSIVFTGFASLLFFAFDAFGFGDVAGKTIVLRISMPEASLEEVRRVCNDKCKTVSIIAIDKSGVTPEIQDVIFELELDRGVLSESLMQELIGLTSKISVSLLVGESSVNV